MELIDKDALVAEIERLKDELKASDSAAYVEAYIIGAEHTIKTISDVIDTLEVREVDLEKETQTFWSLNQKSADSLFIPMNYNGLREIAKHFFELGRAVSNKAQKGEEI